jgi:tRNA(Ile)-lysidine synthase
MNHTPCTALLRACAPEFTACPTNSSYLIGVSGGRDSVALLHGLLKTGYSHLTICHLDHQLRPESTEEAQFVRHLAQSYNLEVIIGQEDVATRARNSRNSLESAARTARYEFFAQVSKQRNCSRLFLAHHADDQIETFLFNLLRGAGPGGLGMQKQSTRSIQGTPITILRPLLSVWRHQIDSYIAQHALKFHDDCSNLDPKFTRNRLRHSIIPNLETAFGRKVRKSLLRTAELLRAEDDWLKSLVGNPPEELSVPALRQLPEAHQRRIIHTWLKHRGITDISFKHVETVLSLLSQPCAKVNLPGNLHVRRREKRLFIERPPPLLDQQLPI